MPFDKKLNSCLIFPDPLTKADEDNLFASKIDRVQLFLGMALQPCSLIPQDPQKPISWAQYLWAMGYELIVRVPEDEAEKGNISNTIDNIRSIAKYLYAVIWGNEPEKGYDLTIESPNYGNKPDKDYPQGKAFYHAYRLGLAIDLLSQVWEVKIGKVRIISPGWSIRQIGESDPEQPGQQVWADICKDVYGRCYAQGMHVYGYGWESPIDRTRALKAVGRMETLFPGRKWWINEFNVFKGTDLQQATAFTEFGDLLTLNPNVEGLALFTSNGTPNDWPAEYLVTDPQAYLLIGQWISP